MKLKQCFNALIGVGLIAVISSPVQALTISVESAASEVELGDTIGIAINVSDLGSFLPPSLGAYEFGLTYDPAILGFTGNTSFTHYLGDPDPFAFETDISVAETVSGRIDFSVVSFLLPTELDLIQPDSFTLATVELSGLALGNSSLALSDLVLTDAFGLTLPGVVQQSGALQVSPSGPSGSVPVPATLLLLFTLLPLLGRREGTLAQA